MHPAMDGRHGGRDPLLTGKRQRRPLRRLRGRQDLRVRCRLRHRGVPAALEQSDGHRDPVFARRNRQRRVRRIRQRQPLCVPSGSGPPGPEPVQRDCGGRREPGLLGRRLRQRQRQPRRPYCGHDILDQRRRHLRGQSVWRGVSRQLHDYGHLRHRNRHRGTPRDPDRCDVRAADSHPAPRHPYRQRPEWGIHLPGAADLRGRRARWRPGQRRGRNRQPDGGRADGERLPLHGPERHRKSDELYPQLPGGRRPGQCRHGRPRPQRLAERHVLLDHGDGPNAGRLRRYRLLRARYDRRHFRGPDADSTPRYPYGQRLARSRHFPGAAALRGRRPGWSPR